MSDELSVLRELDRLNVDIREVRRDYVTEKLFMEMAARVGRLEAAVTTLVNSDHDDRRGWLRGIGLAAIGATCGFIAQLFTAKGGH